MRSSIVKGSSTPPQKAEIEASFSPPAPLSLKGRGGVRGLPSPSRGEGECEVSPLPRTGRGARGSRRLPSPAHRERSQGVRAPPEVKAPPGTVRALYWGWSAQDTRWHREIR